MKKFRKLKEAAKPFVKLGQLPPGDYVIADPCYIIEDKHYDELGKDTDWWSANNHKGGVFKDTRSDVMYAVVGTAYGDGNYKTSEGKDLGVDAGCIACVPVSMIENDKDTSEYITHSFDETIDVSFDGDGGVIRFSGIEIYTDSDPDDDGYEDDEDDDQNEGIIESKRGRVDNAVRFGALRESISRAIMNTSVPKRRKKVFEFDDGSSDGGTGGGSFDQYGGLKRESKKPQKKAFLKRIAETKKLKLKRRLAENTAGGWLDANTNGHIEGTQGVQNFSALVNHLGYDDLTEFFSDNSGAIEAVLVWISDWADRPGNEWGPLLGDNEPDEDEY